MLTVSKNISDALISSSHYITTITNIADIYQNEPMHQASQILIEKHKESFRNLNLVYREIPVEISAVIIC